ncbi:MAG: STAS/SEC14 domain-containing protein [Nostocaceae cyanobacterium]|nr:STAS/SEC14 domain-containing protein [Nostocaceae cyanobacterium]
MNIQLIESLVETIHALSQEEQTILWQKLDYVPATESILLEKIERTLPSIIQQRYDDLRAKLQAETLTPAEHQELLNLTDIIEQFDAERLQHLLALAQLRQVPLPELLLQLNISTPSVYV